MALLTPEQAINTIIAELKTKNDLSLAAAKQQFLNLLPLLEPGDNIDAMLGTLEARFTPTILTKSDKVIGGNTVGYPVAACRGKVAGAAVSGLTGKTRAFWKLGEATGATRADFNGNSNLTDNGTVSQLTPGKIGDAASNDNTLTKYLSKTDNQYVGSRNATFEIAGWFRVANQVANHVMCGKAQLTSGFALDDYEYLLFFTTGGGGRFRFQVRDTGADYAISATTFGALASDTWYFVNARFEKGIGIYIAVNNGTADFLAHTGNVRDDAAAPFTVLRGGLISCNGAVDALGIYNLLTAGERTELYNAGTGKEPPF